MKKWSALALILTVLLFCPACREPEPEPSLRLSEGVTYESLAKKLAEDFDVRDPVELDYLAAAEVLNIRLRDLEAGYGLVSAAEESPDHIIFLMPKKGAEERVGRALRERLAFEQRAYAAHLAGAGPKTAAGRIFAVGETRVLLILGRAGRDPTEEAAEAEQAVRAAFESR